MNTNIVNIDMKSAMNHTNRNTRARKLPSRNIRARKNTNRNTKARKLPSRITRARKNISLNVTNLMSTRKATSTRVAANIVTTETIMNLEVSAQLNDVVNIMVSIISILYSSCCSFRPTRIEIKE